MAVSRETLLRILPPFQNQAQLINSNQEVHDIIKEVVEAHKYFSNDYDLIYQYFDSNSIEQICKNLFDFLKQNVRYSVEKEEDQTTKSPSAILAMMVGDCKHYAGFIAGVLSAINRNTNKNINWCYRFASYSVFNKDVEHVFVVVNDKGKEIWIDPVLNYFDARSPSPVKILNKKISDKMLNRISGTSEMGVILIENQIPVQTVEQDIPFDSTYLISNAQTPSVNVDPQTLEPDYFETDVPAYIVEDIKMLLFYGIIDSNLNIYNDKYLQTLEGLQGQDQTDLANAFGEFMNAIQTNVVGNIFQSIWGTVKQVSLAIPRGAYLSLVSLNVFNLAGHLSKCITNPDGSTDQSGIDQLQGVWHKKLAGDTNILLRAIRNGASKKAILGIGVAPAAPAAAAWAATAAVIIAAMTPIIVAVLKKKNSFDSLTASQLGMQPMTNVSSTTSDLQKYLPFILLAGVVYYVQKK